MESFGQYLRTEREKRGIRLEEISSITKIQLHHLNQLEKSNWDDLPPEPFIRGFILAYAKYVGLSSTDVLGKYEDEVTPAKADGFEEDSAPDVARHTGTSATPLVSNRYEPTERKNPLKLTLQIGFVVVFLCLTVFLVSVGKQSSENLESAPPALAQNTQPSEPTANTAPALSPENLSTAPVPLEPASTVSNLPLAAQLPAQPIAEVAAHSMATPPADPAAFPHEVTVAARERSWMKVVVDDVAPKEQILQAGEKKVFSAKNKIKVVLGYAPGADVLYNGAPSKGKQFSGTIHYFIYPPNARFPQDIPKRTVAEEEKNSFPEITSSIPEPSKNE